MYYISSSHHNNLISLQFILKSDVRVLVWISSSDIRHIRQVAPRVLVTQGNIQVQITVIRYFPSVLWQCWLGDRKDIRPVKVGCWFVVVTIWLKLYSISTNAYVRIC